MNARNPETHMRASVEAHLGRHFKIHREVRGVHCSGKSLRIDAIMEPLRPDGWKDARPIFGVEYKPPRDTFDTRDYTRWCAQAVSYTHCEWEGFGRLMVFACPSPFTSLAMYGAGALSLMERVMGQLGVGALTEDGRYGWTLLLSGHRMWSEREGVRDAGRWSLRPRVGS